MIKNFVARTGSKPFAIPHWDSPTYTGDHTWESLEDVREAGLVADKLISRELTLYVDMLCVWEDELDSWLTRNDWKDLIFQGIRQSWASYCVEIFTLDKILNADATLTRAQAAAKLDLQMYLAGEYNCSALLQEFFLALTQLKNPETCYLKLQRSQCKNNQYLYITGSLSDVGSLIAAESISSVNTEKFNFSGLVAPVAHGLSVHDLLHNLNATNWQYTVQPIGDPT